MKIIIVFLIAVVIGASVAHGLTKVKTTSADISNIHQISLESKKAEPNVVSIKVGEYVQFNAKDGKTHNIAQGEGDEFSHKHNHPEGSAESGKFGPDEAYKVQLKRTGVYHFHDHLNPDIYIAVVVYSPTQPNKL